MSGPRETTDVLVVGGGVIGMTIARVAAERGREVTVLEARRFGAGATYAAAGILSPTDAHEWQGPLGAFNAQAVVGWPAFATALESETGLPSGYETRGELRVGKAEDDFLRATIHGAEAAGWNCEALDRADVAVLEPGLKLGDRIALHLPYTASVNTDQLVAALKEACDRRRVAMHTGTAAKIDPVGRVVTTADGRQIAYGDLVVASGTGVGWLPPVLRPDIEPVLGESLLVRSVGESFCRKPIRTPQGSIVPRSDGTYWLGTTKLRRGYQQDPSLRSVQMIAERAMELLPAIEDAAWVGARSGLRPMSPDGLPVVGLVDDHIVVALGHGREGVIHSPLCASLVADGLDGSWANLPSSFAPDRFRPKT